MAAADSHDTEGLKAALVAAEARAAAAEARIAALTLMIEKLRRTLYGRRSERKERLLDQLELALDELTASATEDELAAENAAARTTEVKGFVRRKPSRKPFPEHLPRERVVVVDDGKEARLFAGVPARGVVFGRRLCAAAVGTVTSAGFCSEVGR